MPEFESGDTDNPSAWMALCRNLSRGQCERVKDEAAEITLDAGDILCRESQPSAHVFAIICGVFKQFKALDDGRRQISRFLHRGDILAVGDCVPTYRWTVQAVTPAGVWQFERGAFEGLLDAIPKLGHNFRDIAWEELDIARSQLLFLAQMTAQEKVARFLLDLAQQRIASGNGEAVELPMTRRDIAEYLGLKTETVSRALTGLQRRAVIALPDPRHAVLLDRDVLESLGCGRKPAAVV